MTAQLTPPLAEDDHLDGVLDAPVVLLQYGDYECAACTSAALLVKALSQRLRGDLCYAYRHFPASGAHPHAERAAEFAEAAGEQAAFWPMHHALYELRQGLDYRHLAIYADALGLDVSRAMADALTGRFAERVHEDFLSGLRSDVRRTPTFFIDGRRYDGPHRLEPMLSALTRQPAADMRPLLPHGILSSRQLES